MVVARRLVALGHEGHAQAKPKPKGERIGSEWGSITVHAAGRAGRCTASGRHAARCSAACKVEPVEPSQ